MLKLSLTLLLMMFSTMMFFLKHPLSMGMMILNQTLLICLISGLLIKTYWFSYILFLTFLGGLLVLFIYVASLSANELFKFSYYTLINLIFFLIVSLIIYKTFMNIDKSWTNFSFNSDMINFNQKMFFNNQNKINLSKLYSNQTYLLMMMLITYLLITLIAVVKITNNFFGPLRMMN